MPDLPVRDVLPEVVAALEDPGLVVLEAPPGAGKTTLTPLALLDAGIVDGRVLILEPRRLAARAAARRMSHLVGDRVGGTVGYVTRDAREVSGRTRIEVVTEGILTRRLQRDPSLPEVGILLFDEFHERSIHADLGLALALESREALRPDLRIGVMSATLEGERVAALLGDAPLIRSEGRMHPVEVRHLPRERRTARIEPDVEDAVRTALAETDAGDILVFLPGAGEIRRVAGGLRDQVGRDVVVTPLFGALSPQEQDRALDPAPPGTRKIVLATDIAQTSLTIEGVRVVIDAGLSREPRFDPGTGMSRLETVPVSRADAEQRCGRAGRVAPGVCYRLWSRPEHHALDAHPRPEIASTDLTGLALDTARWGAADPSELRLLDPPPERHYRAAVGLLQRVGALDEDGRITEHGHRLAELPVHPRLAHAMIRARDLDLGGLGCELAALLADRDVLITSYERPSSDLAARVRVLRGGSPPAGARIRRGTLHRAREQARRLRGELAVGSDDPPLERTGLVLAFAYPDRVAVRRGTRGAFTLANGRGATLPDGDVLAGEDHLVVADVDRGHEEARIHLAAAIDLDAIELALSDHLRGEDVVEWDRQRGDVVAERRVRLDRLVLRSTRLADPPQQGVVEALLVGVRDRGLDLLPWDRTTREWHARVMFLRRTFGADAWPDLSDAALLDDLEGWLAPFLLHARRRADLGRVPLLDAFRAQLGPAQLGVLDELAPTHITVPSGSRLRLDYKSRDEPVLDVRVQELFGATETPRVAGGRVRVTLRLLSPARRPMQVTDDLTGFWERGYPQVRGEMRGRYPKHHWPEDPRTARPTRGVRPR
ncbi:MAG: ATP-dependent helicase HrpB [Actinobacteria bacterium]|nr:ATP-dependent helicase HrpB [Actinomycetota bacterium]